MYNMCMASKKTKNILRYNAIFDPADEGGFTVTVPKLPGLVTEGDTFEEATRMVKDAIVGYLEVLKEAGEEIPEPDNNSFASPIDVSVSGKFIHA